MHRPAGRITQFRLYPIRALWSVGAGWAAVSGGLASGGFALSPETLLGFLLVWILADPMLGTIWSLGVGSNSSSTGEGIWPQIFYLRLPSVSSPLLLLPYTQPDSPGRRFAHWLGGVRHWWRESFWPEAGREFASLVAALIVAVLLGVILGHNTVILVICSVALSWLAVFSSKESGRWRESRHVIARAQSARSNPPSAMAGGAPPPAVARGDMAALPTSQENLASTHHDLAMLWRALGEFGIPWLIGVLALGQPAWTVIALGGCYTIAYFGLIRRVIGRNFRMVAVGQVAALFLLAGTRHPLAAGTMAILLLPQWGLRIWADYLSRRAGGHPAVFTLFLDRSQPFVTLSMLVAALAIPG